MGYGEILLSKVSMGGLRFLSIEDVEDLKNFSNVLKERYKVYREKYEDGADLCVRYNEVDETNGKFSIGEIKYDIGYANNENYCGEFVLLEEGNFNEILNETIIKKYTTNGLYRLEIRLSKSIEYDYRLIRKLALPMIGHLYMDGEVISSYILAYKGFSGNTYDAFQNFLYRVTDNALKSPKIVSSIMKDLFNDFKIVSVNRREVLRLFMYNMPYGEVPMIEIIPSVPGDTIKMSIENFDKSHISKTGRGYSIPVNWKDSVERILNLFEKNNKTIKEVYFVMDYDVVGKCYMVKEKDGEYTVLFY